ncbi:D-glycerate dehydrogenase [Candidatus Berkelbacteria bacterium]|nr:D-glycerate dehydrogenase [Candidatus Berkelbacteria bacterium]
MKVYVTREIPENGLKALREKHEVEVYGEDQVIPRKELLAKIHGQDAVLTLLTEKVDAEFFEAAGKQLKIVANYAVGYDNIDLAEAQKRNIFISNTPGVLTESVAEHAMALMLAVARRVPESDRFMRAGEYTHWMPLGFLGQSLWGKTLGVIGLGRIGSWLAEAAHRSFNMEIMYNDIVHNDEFEMKLSAKYHQIETILKNADVISLHVPLLESTRHLIGKKELSLMKPNAILINTSRGPVIDEAALYEALKSKQIFGAGLDVFENEPKVHPGLDKLDNVVLTPHIASATVNAREEMAEIAANNILNVLDGKQPLNPVK